MKINLIVLSSLLCSCYIVLAEDNLVSRPVGFVKVQLPANTNVLASTPFVPFYEEIGNVFSGQLKGEDQFTKGDCIYKWNTAISKYVKYTKQADPGDKHGAGGIWVDEAGNNISSNVTIMPGEGFFINNSQSSNQVVYFSGEVNLEDTSTLQLAPGLNLVGYPYSTIIDIKKAELWKILKENFKDELIDLKPDLPAEAGQTSTNNIINLGKGYWYNRKDTGTVAWVEVRPYANEFPVEIKAPLISGLQVVEGKSVKLNVICEGASLMDIYYQDYTPSNEFTAVAGWKMLEPDLRVKDMKEFEWEDVSISEESVGRYYMAGRADLDLNKNGIPDAREKFLGLKKYDIPGGSDNTNGTDKSSSTNITGTIEEQAMSGKIIYVDKKSGRDNLTGKSLVIVGIDGPKNTIKGGLNAVEKGGTVIIKDGLYKENVDISGKDVKVIIDGKVRF